MTQPIPKSQKPSNRRGSARRSSTQRAFDSPNYEDQNNIGDLESAISTVTVSASFSEFAKTASNGNKSANTGVFRNPAELLQNALLSRNSSKNNRNSRRLSHVHATSPLTSPMLSAKIESMESNFELESRKSNMSRGAFASHTFGNNTKNSITNSRITSGVNSYESPHFISQSIVPGLNSPDSLETPLLARIGEENSANTNILQGSATTSGEESMAPQYMSPVSVITSRQINRACFMFVLFSTALGSGLMVLPRSCKEGGAIVGVFLIMLGGFLSWVTQYYLFKMFREANEEVLRSKAFPSMTNGASHNGKKNSSTSESSTKDKKSLKRGKSRNGGSMRRSGTVGGLPNNSSAEFNPASSPDGSPNDNRHLNKTNSMPVGFVDNNSLNDNRTNSKNRFSMINTSRSNNEKLPINTYAQLFSHAVLKKFPNIDPNIPEMVMNFVFFGYLFGGVIVQYVVNCKLYLPPVFLSIFPEFIVNFLLKPDKVKIRNLMEETGTGNLNSVLGVDLEIIPANSITDNSTEDPLAHRFKASQLPPEYLTLSIEFVWLLFALWTILCVPKKVDILAYLSRYPFIVSMFLVSASIYKFLGYNFFSDDISNDDNSNSLANLSNIDAGDTDKHLKKIIMESEKPQFPLFPPLGNYLNGNEDSSFIELLFAIMLLTISVLKTVPAFVLAYMSQTNVVSVANHIEDLSEKNLMKITIGNMAAVIFCYFVVIMCTFYTFGDEVEGQYLQNYGSSWWEISLKAMFSCLMVTGVPINFAPLRVCGLDLFEYYVLKSAALTNIGNMLSIGSNRRDTSQVDIFRRNGYRRAGSMDEERSAAPVTVAERQKKKDIKNNNSVNSSPMGSPRSVVDGNNNKRNSTITNTGTGAKIFVPDEPLEDLFLARFLCTIVILGSGMGLAMKIQGATLALDITGALFGSLVMLAAPAFEISAIWDINAKENRSKKWLVNGLYCGTVVCWVAFMFTMATGEDN